MSDSYLRAVKRLHILPNYGIISERLILVFIGRSLKIILLGISENKEDHFHGKAFCQKAGAHFPTGF